MASDKVSYNPIPLKKSTIDEVAINAKRDELITEAYRTVLSVGMSRSPRKETDLTRGCPVCLGGRIRSIQGLHLFTLDRCPVRLVEVEDELGSLSVDDLVASARDQESRLALVRSQVEDIRLWWKIKRRVRISWHIRLQKLRVGREMYKSKIGEDLFFYSHCTSSLEVNMWPFTDNPN